MNYINKKHNNDIKEYKSLSDKAKCKEKYEKDKKSLLDANGLKDEVKKSIWKHLNKNNKLTKLVDKMLQLTVKTLSNYFRELDEKYSGDGLCDSAVDKETQLESVKTKVRDKLKEGLGL